MTVRGTTIAARENTSYSSSPSSLIGLEQLKKASGYSVDAVYGEFEQKIANTHVCAHF